MGQAMIGDGRLSVMGSERVPVANSRTVETLQQPIHACFQVTSKGGSDPTGQMIFTGI
jgi:hypothetical protein